VYSFKLLLLSKYNILQNNTRFISNYPKKYVNNMYKIIFRIFKIILFHSMFRGRLYKITNINMLTVFYYLHLE